MKGHDEQANLDVALNFKYEALTGLLKHNLDDLKNKSNITANDLFAITANTFATFDFENQKSGEFKLFNTYMAAYQQGVTELVTADIIQSDNPKKAYKKWIKLMDDATNLGDINTALAIRLSIAKIDHDISSAQNRANRKEEPKNNDPKLLKLSRMKLDRKLEQIKNSFDSGEDTRQFDASRLTHAGFIIENVTRNIVIPPSNLLSSLDDKFKTDKNIKQDNTKAFIKECQNKTKLSINSMDKTISNPSEISTFTLQALQVLSIMMSEYSDRLSSETRKSIEKYIDVKKDMIMTGKGNFIFHPDIIRQIRTVVIEARLQNPKDNSPLSKLLDDLDKNPIYSDAGKKNLELIFANIIHPEKMIQANKIAGTDTATATATPSASAASAASAAAAAAKQAPAKPTEPVSTKTASKSAGAKPAAAATLEPSRQRSNANAGLVNNPLRETEKIPKQADIVNKPGNFKEINSSDSTATLTQNIINDINKATSSQTSPDLPSIKISDTVKNNRDASSSPAAAAAAAAAAATVSSPPTPTRTAEPAGSAEATALPRTSTEPPASAAPNKLTLPKPNTSEKYISAAIPDESQNLDYNNDSDSTAPLTQNIINDINTALSSQISPDLPSIKISDTVKNNKDTSSSPSAAATPTTIASAAQVAAKPERTAAEAAASATPLEPARHRSDATVRNANEATISANSDAMTSENTATDASLHSSTGSTSVPPESSVGSVGSVSPASSTASISPAASITTNAAKAAAIAKPASPPTLTTEEKQLIKHVKSNLPRYLAMAKYYTVAAERAANSNQGQPELEHIKNACSAMSTQISTYQQYIATNDPNNTQHLTLINEIKANLTETQNQTHTSAKIAYFSDKSTIIEAPPGRSLDEEINRHLASSNTPPQSHSSLSTEPTIKTTEAFQDKARISETSIQTKRFLRTDQVASVTSVQRMRDETFVSEFHFDPSNIKHFRPDDYLKWAVVEVENFRAGNPGSSKPITIKGDMPPELIKHIATYCAVMGYHYENCSNKFIPGKSDIASLEKRLEKNKDIIYRKSATPLAIPKREITREEKYLLKGPPFKS